MAVINITSKDITRLAFPAIIAGIAEPLISLTDTAIVGNLEGQSVSATLIVGIVGSFLSAIIWTVAQTKTSISSIVSRAYGSNKLESIQSLIPQVIWINCIIGILIYAMTVPLSNLIFSAYKTPDELLELTNSYYSIRAIGFPLTLCTFAIFGVFRGVQNTSWAMIASLSGALINVILDYILVYGIDGYVERYGVLGAAYASVAAQTVMLIIALYFFFTRTDFGLSLKAKWTPNPLLPEHFKLTFNFLLRTAAINIAIYLSYRYAADYGSSIGAAHTILMNIWLFFSFFVDGFANAGNALGGKLLGAKDVDSLAYLGKKISLYGVGVAVCISLLCAVFYIPIAEAFTADLEVKSAFIRVFWLVLLMQPVNAIAFVFDGIFKGWGEARYLRNLLLMLTLIVFIPSLLILDLLGLELYAIWIAFTLWMLGRAVILYFKFNSRLTELANSKNGSR